MRFRPLIVLYIFQPVAFWVHNHCVIIIIITKTIEAIILLVDLIINPRLCDALRMLLRTLLQHVLFQIPFWHACCVSSCTMSSFLVPQNRSEPLMWCWPSLGPRMCRQLANNRLLVVRGCDRWWCWTRSWRITVEHIERYFLRLHHINGFSVIPMLPFLKLFGSQVRRPFDTDFSIQRRQRCMVNF